MSLCVQFMHEFEPFVHELYFFFISVVYYRRRCKNEDKRKETLYYMAEYLLYG